MHIILQNGEYLDSCIFLGTDSSYSVSKDDCVFLERGNKGSSSLNSPEERTDSLVTPKGAANSSAEFVIELQVFLFTYMPSWNLKVV